MVFSKYSPIISDKLIYRQTFSGALNMLKVNSRFPAITLIALSCVACSSMPVQQAGTARQATAMAKPSAAVGSVIELPKGNALGARHARLLDEYHSASGRVCRRVAVENTADAERVLCKREDGQWRLTRSLRPGRSGNTFTEHPDRAAPLVDSTANGGQLKDSRLHAREPELSAASELIPESGMRAGTERVAPIQLPMREGETLWTFSLRTTGKAENWKVLAQINAIDDVSRIPRGTTLSVPVDLYAGSQ